VIDSAPWEDLIPEGATWRFFRGWSEPSPGLEWTQPGFDDSSWESGPSGFGYGDDDDATVLSDMQNNYTTVYIRCSFPAPDRDEVRNLFLSVKADDGFVAYLNGKEVGRTLAGKPEERLPFDALASGVAVEPLILNVYEIDQSLLMPEGNVLALQGLNATRGSSDLSLIPVLQAVPFHPGVEKALEILSGLQSVAGGDDASSRIAYLEGRLLQRGNDLDAAASKFGDLLTRNPRSPEPLLRLGEVRVEQGQPGRAEDDLRQALLTAAWASGDRRVWELWIKTSLAILGHSAAEALANFPQPSGESPPGLVDDFRWVLSEIADGRPIRIDCGEVADHESNGVAWSRDRLFFGGHDCESLDQVQGDPMGIHQRGRNFPKEVGTGYRIPLPPGQYRVSLHFVEAFGRKPGGRIFDVLLEGKSVLENYEPMKMGGYAIPQREVFQIAVADGMLDVVFVQHAGDPLLSAIEIESIQVH
jgi:hypothetical protein